MISDDENNNLEQSALQSTVVWRRKNYRKKSTDYLHCRITCTAVLPAPLTFCVKINRLPVGNPPENMEYIFYILYIIIII